MVLQWMKTQLKTYSTMKVKIKILTGCHAMHHIGTKLATLIATFISLPVRISSNK